MRIAICKSAKLVKTKSKKPRALRVVNCVSYIEVESIKPFWFRKGDLISIGGEVFIGLRAVE